MEDEQAEDRGENGAAPEPEVGADAEGLPEAGLEPGPDLDEVEPELLVTFTEIGIVETRRAIEAILLVASDPTPASLLAQLLEVQVEHVELLCHALADSYEEANHGFQLVKVAGGWRFQTHPDMAPYVERFAMDGQSSKLSNAALETLAIVAYKQPISRAQVSAIRGVNVDAVLRTLVQRGYVDEVGRDTGAGQAVLFGTTSMFLERLGINTVADLPALGDFVPSAEVVEALEQTLKVDLDPDLIATDRDGDEGPTRPPNQALADGVEPGDAEGPHAEEPEAEEPEAEAAEPADEAQPGADPGGAAEIEAAAGGGGEAEAEPEVVVDGGPVEHAEVEPAAVAAEDEAVPPSAAPVNERAAEQAGVPTTATSEAAVIAPEGVVVDAEASPKSGADRPLGPGGEPSGHSTDGGQPRMADPAPAPLAHARGGNAAGDDGPPPGSGGGSDPQPGRQPSLDVERPHASSRAGTGIGQPDAAAGRADHPVPTGHEPGDGQVHGVDDPAGSAAPNPTIGGQPAARPDAARAGDHGSAAPRWLDRPLGGLAEPSGRRPEGGARWADGHTPVDPVDGAGTGGSSVAGPADPAVPSAAGPGLDLTAAPDVDLRPSVDLTDAPAPSPTAGIGPEADGWPLGAADS